LLTRPLQTLKASKALLAHIKTAKASQVASETKKNLLADAESPEAEVPIYLTLTTKKNIHPSRRLQPGKILIPHSLNTDPESTICIFTASPQRAYKDIFGSDEVPEALRKRITRVIDLNKLKAKFKAYEAQRKLYSEHDIFLADDRIINQLPKVLGKSFYKTTTKRPIPIVLMASRERVDGKRVLRSGGKKEQRDPLENVNARPTAAIVAEVETALSAALVHLAPSTNTAVRVGYANWTAEQLTANAHAIVSALVERFVPQKWNNVRSIYLKGPETAALPLWQTDELWADQSQVVADGADGVKAIGTGGAEKSNIGKKRKSLEAGGDADGEAEKLKERSRPTKKAKLPEGDDEKLDKEIAERKAKLKKQKKAAKQAMDA
jgi:ribosome biogenesis protein UTP30